MTTTSGRISSSLIPLLLVIAAFNFSKALAEEPAPITLEKVETDTIRADRFGASRPGGGSKEQKWIIIEFSFLTNPPKDKKNDFLDEVQFKVMVEAREDDGPLRGTTPVFLTGEVTYVCVSTMGKGMGSFYISPDVAARYHIDRSLSQLNVNVQAFINGQSVSSKDKRREDKDDWYANYKTIPNLVFTKNQSPFILNDLDRYPTIKPKTGN
jgi:hypothetical protein